jgi:hypothetical protein
MTVPSLYYLKGANPINRQYTIFIVFEFFKTILKTAESFNFPPQKLQPPNYTRFLLKGRIRPFNQDNRLKPGPHTPHFEVSP